MATQGHRPAVILLACSLIAAGTLTPTARMRALRAISTLCGATAASLRRASLAAGLRYVDLAYPPGSKEIEESLP